MASKPIVKDKSSEQTIKEIQRLKDTLTPDRALFIVTRELDSRIALLESGSIAAREMQVASNPW